MSKRHGYRRRAHECLAFARNTHNAEERTRLLIMAEILERIAVKNEQKAEVRTTES